MKLRENWNSLNKAEKLGRKNLFRCVTIVSTIYAGSVFVFSLMLFQCVEGLVKRMLPVCLFVCLLFWLLFAIFLWCLKKESYINAAYDKLLEDYSKEKAEQLLIEGQYHLIELLHTTNNVYEEFFLDLQGDKKVEFYALLLKNGQIEIYAKLVDEVDNYRFLSLIKKEDFLKYCRCET